MGAIRLFLRDHRRFAALLAALALAMKALVPAGYMVGGDARIITISICADSIESRYTRQIVVPQSGKTEHVKDGQACPFSALAMASLSAVDPALLATALAFILTLGFAATAPPPDLAKSAHLRPPLRGPPATA